MTLNVALEPIHSSKVSSKPSDTDIIFSHTAPGEDSTSRSTVGVANSDPSFSHHREKQLDIIGILPPEISWRCLLEALPPPGNIHHSSYPAVLFQFTAVSKAWQDLILHSPSLWSEVHMDTSADDLLATIAIFTQLSGATPLEIVVYNYLMVCLDDICDLLLPHKDRIYKLVLKTRDPGRFNNYEGQLNEKLGYIRVFFRKFGHMSNLSELDFGLGMTIDLAYFNSFPLPSTVKITSPGICVIAKIGYNSHLIQQYSFVWSTQIDEIAPALGSLNGVLSLSFLNSGSSFRDPDPPTLKSAPSTLHTFVHMEPYCTNVTRLMQLTASHLRHLTLQVPGSNLAEVIETLMTMAHLQSLSLELVNSRLRVLPIEKLPPNSIIKGLHTLKINFETSEQRTSIIPPIHLLDTFASLYPSITHANFRVVSTLGWLSLDRFRFLKRLDIICTFTGLIDDLISLPSLESLTAQDVLIIRLLHTPNLLHLRFKGVSSNGQLAGLGLPSLHTLEIQSNAPLDFSLDPLEFSELQELKIESLRSWNLSSFPSLPSLRSITWDERNPLNCNGIQLCFTFILYPELCPSLEQLHLLDFIDWDVLFLMLERRNFNRIKVKKINTVTIPFVPPVLRKAFSDLLSGIPTHLPSGLDLSREGTREILLDTNVLGCVTCLKSMRPSCLNTVEANQGYPLFWGVFSYSHKLPDRLPSKVREWITQREQWENQWNISNAPSYSKSSRKYWCSRYTSSTAAFEPLYLTLL